jgi:hypothetical protein
MERITCFREFRWRKREKLKRSLRKKETKRISSRPSAKLEISFVICSLILYAGSIKNLVSIKMIRKLNLYWNSYRIDLDCKNDHPHRRMNRVSLSIIYWFSWLIWIPFTPSFIGKYLVLWIFILNVTSQFCISTNYNVIV